MENNAVEEIKKLVEKGLEPQLINERYYSAHEYNPIREPKIQTVNVYSLQSLVLAVKTLGLSKPCFARVASPTLVAVGAISPDKWKQRTWPLEADVGDLVNNFSFGEKLDQEQFIIDVQANFDKTPGRDKLIQTASNVSLDDSSSLKDDGTTQTVTAKRGVTLKENIEIKNPVLLKPFKSFPEIPSTDQQFIFRVSKGGRYDDDLKKPMFALHSSKSRLWELQVMEEIRKYLKKRLPGIAIV